MISIQAAPCPYIAIAIEMSKITGTGPIFISFFIHPICIVYTSKASRIQAYLGS